jgi:hypothetical protein
MFRFYCHPRGSVIINSENIWGVRFSVWINQEIGILAYRKYFEGIDLPILVFKDPTIKIEGAMTSFIVNPKPFQNKNEVIKEVGHR